MNGNISAGETKKWGSPLSEETLRQILADHRKWVDTKGAEGQRADLLMANVRGAELGMANLRGAKLDMADLSGANLDMADLGGATLWAADLSKATLLSANLNEADLTGAKLIGTNLTGAKLIGADLTAAKLEGAVLLTANLSGAKLDGADFSRTDLRVHGRFLPNYTNLRLAHIDPRSKDPWSVLRRNYTGTRLLFHIVLMLAFFVPLSARTMFWIGVNNGQKTFLELQTITLATMKRLAERYQPPDGLIREFEIMVSDPQPCMSNDCVELHVWQVLLDFDKGWLLCGTAGLIMFYQLVRAFLTWRVGPLRDEEERSGWSPGYDAKQPWVPERLRRWLSQRSSESNDPMWVFFPIYREYKSLYTLHRFAQILLLLAIGSFGLHLWTWLSATVSVPVR